MKITLSILALLLVLIGTAAGEETPEGGESGDVYLVYPPPFENPDDAGGIQTPVEDPAEPAASPFGWHDTDGADGAEFTDTRGNNVSAQTDPTGHNNGTFRPDGDVGGPNLEFTFLHDPDLEPDEGTNAEAAVTNLFYWANRVHDVAYLYGFDEAAGNFQINNYGRGGLGDDPMFADAQDGGCENCAQITTPPDGLSGRMNLSTWVPLVDRLVTVLSPASIAGDYDASSADFGADLDAAGVTGEVERVDDGDDSGGGSIHDGCQPLIDFTAGNVALIDRGTCEFGTKALNAEIAGATAAIVVNDQPGLLHMGAGLDGGSVTLPAVMITEEDGEVIKGELGGGVVATVRDHPVPDLDLAFDNGIVAHEYGHGISSRLTGGPANAGCLSGSEQAGEGWSDFWTLVLSAKATDTPELPRTIGGYVAGGPGVLGLRNYPYSTDLSVNPLTYADVGTINIPHGVGEVWMSMLWEVYWGLVGRYGFDPDVGRGDGGNNLTIRLVVDGLKLQPCDPTFVDARDAILLAGEVAGGGANECVIWRAFAKRGLGALAFAGSDDVGDETEDFTVPEECGDLIFFDGFESGDTSAWSSTARDSGITPPGSDPS